MPEYLESELSETPAKQLQKTEEELSELEKPYLKSSDMEGSPQKEVLTLEWMDFLLSKTDMQGVLDALSYYIEMGWIGRGVRSQLMSYTRYFFQSKNENPVSEIKMGEKSYKVGGSKSEESSNQKQGGDQPGELSLQDHIRSLGYILNLSDRADEKVRQEIMNKVKE